MNPVSFGKGQVSLPSNTRLIITSWGQNGQGDSSGAYKLYDIFKKYLSDSQIGIRFKGSYHGETFAKYYKEKPESIRGDLKEFNPSLIIDYPSISTEAETKNKNTGTPILNIGEYDGGNICLGLGDESLGIFINQDLKTYSMDNANKKSINRLQNLKSLPAKLQETILGCTIHNPEQLSEEIKKFDETKRLFFGYAHNETTRTNFAFSMVEFNKRLNSLEGTKKEPVIILVGSKFLYSILLKNLREEAKDNLVIYDTDSKITDTTNFRIENIQPDKNSSSSAKIIIGSLLHGDFIQLLKASEPEVMLTGDQSLSEGLSAGKKIFYEFLNHKRQLSYNMMRHIKQFDAELADKYYNLSSDQSMEDISADEATPLLADYFLDFRTNIDFKIAWDKFIKDIHEKHDVEPQIIKKVSEVLKKTAFENG